MEKNCLKRALFDNRIVSIFLGRSKSRIPLWIFTKLGSIVPENKGKIFRLRKVQKIWHHLTMSQNSFCTEKSQQSILYQIPRVTLNKISWAMTKLGMQMSDTCDHVTKRFKTFEQFLRQNKGSRNPKRTKNALFWYFFYLHVSHVQLLQLCHHCNQHKITKLEHYATFVNTPNYFYNIFITLSSGSDMPKMAKISIWLSSKQLP